jgi:hypothetical protein
MSLVGVVVGILCMEVGYELGRFVQNRSQRQMMDMLLERDAQLLEAQRELTGYVREMVDEVRSGRLSRMH